MRRFLIIFTSLIVVSCYYSFKGSLPSHLKSIAIPIFVDKSGYPGIQNKVTDAITESFLNDNTLSLVNESVADVILKGTIESVDQKVASVTAGETVAEYQMYVSVKVVCEDVNKSKKMYEKVFRQYGSMANTAGQAEKDEAIDDAIALITEDVLNSTLGGW